MKPRKGIMTQQTKQSPISSIALDEDIYPRKELQAAKIENNGNDEHPEDARGQD